VLLPETPPKELLQLKTPYPSSFESLAKRLSNSSAFPNGSRIFITGGTGFFGKWLLRAFRDLYAMRRVNLFLTVLSRTPDLFLSENPSFADMSSLRFVAGDIRTFDFSSLPPFDLFIHGATAASATLEQENPGEMFSVITDGTRHVLNFAKQCKRKPRRLLFISSGAVYGTQPGTLSHVPETHEGTPVTAYGRGKKIAEQMCLDAAAADGFDCVIARPFAFVGPYLPLDTHFAIGNFIGDCLANRPIIIRGDGTPLRSYLYASDLAEWLWTILLKGENGRAYNVGSDQAVSILDLARLVRECAGTNNPIQVLGTPDPGVPPPRYVPSIERARKELGLDVCCPLKDAITKTLEWHRASGPRNIFDAKRNGVPHTSN